MMFVMVLVFIPTLDRLKTPHQSGNRTYDLLERQTNALPSELGGQVGGELLIFRNLV